MPQPCSGTLNYKHDEPTSFFFSIPIEAAHRRLPRRPPLLGGGVAATKPAGDREGWAEEEEEGGQQEGRGDGTRDKRAACQGIGTAEEERSG